MASVSGSVGIVGGVAAQKLVFNAHLMAGLELHEQGTTNIAQVRSVLPWPSSQADKFGAADKTCKGVESRPQGVRGVDVPAIMLQVCRSLLFGAS